MGPRTQCLIESYKIPFRNSSIHPHTKENIKITNLLVSNQLAMLNNVAQ